jgi:two-component system chemotaxis response regulator CheY
MRSLVRSCLQQRGFHRVIESMDGKEAVEVLRNQPVSLLVCDWNMPKVSGLELLESVRRCDETKTLPFLMLTSVAESTSVKEAILLGVTDYLVKPFQPQQLIDKVIKQMLRSRHAPARAPSLKVPVRVVPQSGGVAAPPSAEEDVLNTIQAPAPDQS